jgi:ComEC/Rec2-related protein
MEVLTIRSGDAAFGFAAIFLFGIFSAASGWNGAALFLCMCAVATGVIFYFPRLRSRAFVALIGFAIVTFPLSVFYYHLRVSRVAVDDTSFTTPSAVNPLFASAALVFEKNLPERQASLIAGIVSGSTTVLAPDVKLAMSQSGTSYIIGMYGYKIYLLAEVVRAMGKKFCSRRVASIIALIAIANFIAAANAPISALRAGIMAGLFMLAEATGRKFNARIALMFTAVFMVIFDPTILTSGGFLLSFMSLVGIYALAPSFKLWLQKILGDHNKSGGNNNGFLGWKSHLVTTIAVNLAILPIVSVMYGDFPAISFVSNFLIAIPFGAVIALGIALAMIGSVFPAAAIVITPILNILLSYQLFVVKIFAGAAWSVPPLFSSPFALVVYYSMLAWFVFRSALHALNTHRHADNHKRVVQLVSTSQSR